MSAGKFRVLVVDDEPQLTQMVAYAFEIEGMEVHTARSAGAGWELFQEIEFDLMVLDVMLPDMSGVSLCERVRAQSNVPVILLTALGETQHRVRGLEAGADDYLVKPFSPRELILRSNAILRRWGTHGREQQSVVSVGTLSINPESLTSHIDGRKLEITGMEGKLLLALISRKGQIISIRELLNEVWGTSATQSGRNMVKSTIHRLRKKLEHAGLSPDCISAVRGQGYVFDLED